MSGAAFFLLVLALCGLSELYVRVRCVRCWWRIRRDGKLVCRRCWNAAIERTPAPRELLRDMETNEEFLSRHFDSHYMLDELDEQIDQLFAGARIRGEVER